MLYRVAVLGILLAASSAVYAQNSASASLASTNSRTLSHTQVDCKQNLFDTVCDRLEGRYGSLNLAYLDASRESVTRSGSITNTVVKSLFTTIGIPSAAVAFYESTRNQNIGLFDVDWSAVVRALIDNEKNDANVLNIASTGFLIGVAMPRLIEYVDTNNNQIYDVGVDTVVSDYNFETEGEWKALSVSQRTGSNGETVLTYTAETDENPPVFKLSWSTASARSDLEKVSLSPNSLKMDIEVRYPFEGTSQQQTRVAIEQYVFSSRGSLSTTVTANSIPFEDYLVYNWVSSADVEYDIADNLQNGSVEVSTGEWESFTRWNDTNLQYGFSSALTNIYAQIALRRNYHSFRAVRPRVIRWDPQLFITPTLENEFLNAGVSAFGAQSFLVLIALIAMILTQLMLV
jgi:hypothetical protein